MIETMLTLASQATPTLDMFGNASSFSLFWAIAAIGGGILGAAIGGNWAFVMTGFTVFLSWGIAAGTGSTIGFDYIAFGPVFGPHICFAAGAAAAAYCGSKGYLGDAKGRDINTSMSTFKDLNVYLIGACFGLGGYLLERAIRLIPFLGGHTDTVALTVFTSAIVARLIWGSTGIFKWVKPNDKVCWLPWQQRPAELLAIGIGASIFSSGVCMVISTIGEVHGFNFGSMVHTIPFGISAISIFFLILGYEIPVTHHITITSGLAAVTYLGITGNPFLGMLVAVVFGVMATFGAEFVARLMLDHGDTHIDPPAGIIWFMNTVVMSSALFFA